MRLNQDLACMPQDEMSIAINPEDTHNVFGGANDYRLGWGSSGFYVTTDRGHNWYDGITHFPTPGSYPSPAAPKDHIDGGGDPISIFDRGGTAYYGQIRFERENDTGGIFVNRSTNGGFTWTRPCVPNAGGVCGGNGDPRQPGDGVVTFNPDPDGILNGSIPFDDKPYGTAGPEAGRGRSAVLHGYAHTDSVPGRSCRPGSDLHHVDPIRRRGLEDLREPFRRSGSVVVAGTGHQRQCCVLRRRSRRLQRQPGLTAARPADERRRVRALRELRHA